MFWYNINLNVSGINDILENETVIAFLTTFGIIIFLFAILLTVLGCVVGVGYAKFNLNLVDNKKLSFDTLFSYFPYMTNLVVTKLLQTLYIFLWSLLLLIPGIIKSLSYAMTGYILAENPELSYGKAITLSRKMMRGNKMRLFLLTLSFVGWIILSIFTLGIGLLWLNPYINASMAAFYREVSRTEGYREETIYYDI